MQVPQTIRSFLLFTFILFSNHLSSQNEVIITPVIAPPYSPYLADYQDKAIIILQNTTSDQLSIKLTGRIEGDNGYLLFTRPDYFPNSPILLSPYESRTIIVSSEASDFLDFDNLETNVSGSVQRNIISSGILPEGNYSFCVEAREFPGSRLLSTTAPAGCVPINISYPEPPVLINPICEAVLDNNLPIISWTPPIGNLSEAFINYDLYVVPLQENENPFEAIDRAYSYQGGNPIIFRDLIEPIYIWQAYDIPLEVGRTYAVQVVARDLNERIQFNNSGRSEVCTFTIGNDFSFQGESTLEEQGINQYFQTTNISGKLLYRFPGRSQVAPVQSNGNQIGLESEIVELNQEILHAPLNYNAPIIINQNPINTTDALPMANKVIKLVVHTQFTLPHTAGESPEYFYSRPHNAAWGASPSHPLNHLNDEYTYQQGQVLAVTQTDEQGNFDFDFIQLDSLLDIGAYYEGVGTAYSGSNFDDIIDATAGGQIITNPNQSVSFKYIAMHQVLRIEIESSYYCSPDISVIIQPDQDLELPPIVSLVKSYNLEVTTRANLEENQQSTAGAPLPQMQVEVLRGTFESITNDVPENEGQNLGEFEIIPPGFNFRILSRGETGLNGNVLFRNLVKHPISTIGKYVIRAKSKESYTAYSYQPASISYPPGNGIEYSNNPMVTPYVHGNGVFPMDAILGHNNRAIFNSEYDVPTFETEIIMAPDKPVVFGRVKHDFIGLSNVVVDLYKNGQILRSDLSDLDGYFEFPNLEAGHGYQLSFSRYGYEDKVHPPSVFSLEMGTFIDFGEIELIPLGNVYGYVTNESGEPVLADVKIADSPWYPTDLVYSSASFPITVEPDQSGDYLNTSEIEEIPQKAIFNFPAQTGKALKLIIDPYSDQYFRDTFLVSIPFSGSELYSLGTFIIPEKLHRPQFIISQENGGAVIGAKVYIQDLELTTNRIGQVHTTFASPGSNFLVRIDPPEGSDLVPYQETIYIPVSKDYIPIPIQLVEGASISGQVTAGPDNTPVEGARVFLDDYQVWDYELPLLETLTDAQGNYTLSGLPEEYVYTANGQAVPLTLTIRATKSDPDIAYIGDVQQIIVPNSTSVNFHLEILENVDFSQIWGFPVEIESASPEGTNQYKLSGAFVNLPSNDNFQLLLPETRLDFYNIPVQLIPGNNGKLIIDPDPEAINLDVLNIPVGITNSFQGSLHAIPNINTSNLVNPYLQIKEESPGQGLIEGRVEMDLASFEFSYNYTGKLLLGETPNEAKVAVFRPEGNSYPAQSFSVMELFNFPPGETIVTDPIFSVHEFSATADRFKSYINQDTVALFTVLHTNIPLANPPDLEIQAGFIHITPTDILSFKQGEELQFNLEAWQFDATEGWFYDKNNGGIHIPKATINTGSLDVPIKDLIIRYDDIDVGELIFNKRQNGGISLGGVAELEITGKDPVFYLDPKVPTDLQPHWRIELMSDGQIPAAKTDIPEFNPGQIEFRSFSLISNGEEYLVLDTQTVWIYSVMELQLQSIQTSQDYFILGGQADLHIPDVPGTSTFLTFSKPGSEVVMNMDHLEVSLDGIGKVEFIDNNFQGAQFFNPGKFTASGTLRAYDDQQNSISLEAHLIRTPTECRIEIIKVDNQNQQIICGGSGSNYLEITTGVMPANLNSYQWESFEFDAYPRSSKGLNAQTNLIHFEVLGDIVADDASITVTDIPTPFGNLQLTFDLEDLSLSAYLNVTQDIPMGVVTIKQADINFLMAEKGFYFLMAASGDVPVVGVIDVVTLVGHYSEFSPLMLQIWEDYTYQAVPAEFQNGFSGFIINGKWTPVDASAGIDIIPEIVYMDFYAGINVEVRITADFGEDYYEFSVLGAGEFLLAFGGPCFDTGVGILVEILVGARIENSDFDIFGCASVNLLGYYQACAPFGIPPLCLDWCSSDCWSGGVRVDLVIGESVGGIDLSVDLGGPSCSGTPMQIESIVQDLGVDCD